MRITFPLSAIALTSAVALASCSSVVPEPTPAPTPTPVAAPKPAPPPVVTGDWTEWPLAQGDWVYRTDSRGSLALFGAPGDEADVIIRCDRNENRIYISRAGKIANGGQMTLRGSSGLQTYTARDTGGALPYAAISMAVDDYMLDRIVFSRGRFAVETTGLAPLAIPTWSEFNRVVEDCRS